MRHLRQDAARRLFDKLIDKKGLPAVTRDGLVQPRSMRADLAGDCQHPVLVHQRSRPNQPNEKFVVVRKKAGNVPFDLEYWVRCRMCEKCMAARSARWRYRIADEVSAAGRTWLLSLTFRPDVHQKALDALRHRLDKSGVDLASYDDLERFKLLADALGKYGTLYFKRLRKADCQFRYVFVAEAHKTGLPHFHALIHETGDPVRHSALVGAWEWGFIHAKLVQDVAQAAYVAKYLSKTMGARVRASIQYGKPKRPDAVAPKGVKRAPPKEPRGPVLLENLDNDDQSKL